MRSAALLLLIGCIRNGLAHTCSGGSRVTCTKVQSTDGAPSTNGESYGAKGWPLCTPEGKRVYCLVDHDYHSCGSGKAPCCHDGYPHHHHQNNNVAATSEEPICKASTAAATVTTVAAATVTTVAAPVSTMAEIAPVAVSTTFLDHSHDHVDSHTAATDHSHDHVDSHTAATNAPEDVQDGVLSLRLSAKETGIDLLVMLDSNKTVLAATLRAYFGLRSVRLTSLLRGGRRLAAAEVFRVSFHAVGAAKDAAGYSLAVALQDDFDKAFIAITVHDASVEWPGGVEDTDSSSSSSMCTPLVVIAIIGAVAVSTSLAGFLILWCRRWRTLPSEKEATSGQPSEPAQLQKAIDDDDGSASTATPPSDGNSSDGGQSATQVGKGAAEVQDVI